MVDRRQKRRFVVYQIKNTKNLAKVLVESTPNLKTMNGKLMLLRGEDKIQLREDWKNKEL
ncbi:hypothetical protein Desca_0023 [Desulfotomaculum nigrificans CO-1-SRB]|uniref:Uncharacterized protein n=1 Tax=Desulfotomaculum nigrificans (strain DSM 14880 / VKM B-2319 / CO-1-SRB) TaxID=868595 RepID=F6B3W3_DESCC|nr:hypothetical protein Desca_0023 [Desulfotomaculum nigrificans CO-1-SRB]